jgi:hypothetical protein
MYGKKDATDSETVFLRVLSGMNFVTGVTMIAAKAGIDTAVSTCAIAWAIAICYNIPLFEKFDVPKGPLVGFIVTMGAVGELARQGILKADLAFNIVVPGFLIAISIGELIGQKQTIDMYKMPAVTALTKSLLTNFDMTKIALGLFLLTSKLTGKTGLGLAAMSAGLLANIIITGLNSDTGIEKGGLVFWGVMQGAIGTLAFLNEK